MAGRITLDDEFRKNSELKKEDFQAFKDWYSLQSFLPPIQDELLVQIFHSCWFKMEPSKRTADYYFTIRTHAPDIFANRDPLKVNLRGGKPVVDYCFLSKTTPNNERACLIKLANLDPSVYVFSEVSKAFTMHYDMELYMNGTKPGDIIIFDMAGISLGHLARLNPSVAKKILYYLQDGMPIRLTNLHMINVVPFIDKIMAILRPFMKKELLDQLVFHTQGIESLYKYVPLKILPRDYGGEDKSIAELSEERIKLLHSNKAWFEEEEKLRVDESKRPTKKQNEGTVFGLDGSFKKLDFD